MLAEQLTPDNELFLSERCRRLIDRLRTTNPQVESALVASLAETMPDSKMSLDIVYLKAQELWKDFETAELEREFAKLLIQAKRQYVSGQLTRLEFDIKTAEKNKDKVLLASLLADFSKIGKELGN